MTDGTADRASSAGTKPAAAIGNPIRRILVARGLRATLFVPTAYVGGTARWLRDCGESGRPLLSWSALRDALGDDWVH